jgi:hypothetical protein
MRVNNSSSGFMELNQRRNLGSEWNMAIALLDADHQEFFAITLQARSPYPI